MKCIRTVFACLAVLVGVGGAFVNAPAAFAACAGTGRSCLKAGVDCKGVVTTDICPTGEFCCNLTTPTPAATSGGGAGGLYGYTPPLGANTTVEQLVGRIIQTALPVIGAVFLAMFLWGGTLYLTAGGDEKKVTSARKTLTSAVIGMAIVLGAYVIVANILGILGTAIRGTTTAP